MNIFILSIYFSYNTHWHSLAVPGVTSSLVLGPQAVNSKHLIPKRVGMLTSVVVRFAIAKFGLPTVSKHCIIINNTINFQLHMISKRNIFRNYINWYIIHEVPSVAHHRDLQSRWSFSACCTPSEQP